MHEASECWERGRLVRTPLNAFVRIVKTASGFSCCALSADGASAFPANQLIDSLGQDLSEEKK